MVTNNLLIENNSILKRFFFAGGVLVVILLCYVTNHNTITALKDPTIKGFFNSVDHKLGKKSSNPCIYFKYFTLS